MVDTSYPEYTSGSPRLDRLLETEARVEARLDEPGRSSHGTLLRSAALTVLSILVPFLSFAGKVNYILMEGNINKFPSPKEVMMGFGSNLQVPLLSGTENSASVDGSVEKLYINLENLESRSTYTLFLVAADFQKTPNVSPVHSFTFETLDQTPPRFLNSTPRTYIEVGLICIPCIYEVRTTGYVCLQVLTKTMTLHVVAE